MYRKSKTLQGPTAAGFSYRIIRLIDNNDKNNTVPATCFRERTSVVTSDGDSDARRAVGLPTGHLTTGKSM